MSAATDNAYPLSGSNHISLGRVKRQMSPAELVFWKTRREAARSGVLERKDFNPINHPRIPKGRPGGGRFTTVTAVLDVITSKPDPRGETRAHALYGRGLDAMFPPGGAERVTTPWRSMGRRRDLEDYDRDLVRAALQVPPRLRLIDPRGLRSSQPMVTRAGVEHYMGDDFDRLGRTFEPGSNPGNKYPFIYQREDGEDLILAGHHRAAAALLKGEPLEAIVVSGPWGRPRGGAS